MTTAWAAVPLVEVAWKGASARLEVHAPEGAELAADAPGRLELAWASGTTAYDLPAAQLVDVAVPDLRGATLEGELRITLCSKADGACTPHTWALSGPVGTGRKGRASLALSEGTSGPAEPSPFNRPVGDAVDAALAAAKATGRPVLLDFSAVWCPPCNLLSAEVLHAEDPPEALAGYEVVVVDVDHPSSNELKARYAVGGYPTVVVTDGSGTELSRMVGYPGRSDFTAWLSVAAGRTDAADLAAGPAAVSPERALELAWSLLQDRRADDARPFAERGAQVDSVLARRVRVALEPTEADARWLLAHDPDGIHAWMGAALDLREAHPELAAAIADAAVARLEGAALADALWVSAEVSGEAWRYAAAASALRTALSGDPEADRGHLTWLADLTAHNDLDGALAVLHEARARWPDEPTWDLSAAGLLADAGRPAESLDAARAAAAVAWGDNALRAARAVAEAQFALSDPSGACATLREALEAPAPDAALKVRTHRYRQKLEELAASCD